MPSPSFRPLARHTLLWPLLLSAVTGLPSNRPVSSRAPFTRLGCFTDVPQRTLAATSKADDNMTVEVCAEYCSSYQYFGVEYGRECYCGNTRDAESVTAPDAECSFACAGDATQTCGAGMRLDLYINDAYSAYDPGDTAPPGAPYLGCFVDAAVHVLPERLISVDDMTPAKCAANCEGYTYFGTQYSRECYCGNIAPTEAVAQSECNMPCSGDAAEMCGAGMRLSVYGPVGAAPSTPEAVGDFAYDGCYTDSIAVRTLSGFTITSADMTPASCATTCADYTYFGLEDSDQCFCGMDLDASAVKSAETDCALKCGGDNSLICGNANRLSVYKKNTVSAPPSNPETIGIFSYQSCWTDAVGARSLAGKSEARAEMTVEMCAAFCDGYAYFGVEFSTECYCGNELAGGEAAVETDCSSLCGGSASQWCGAANRLNLYAANPLPSPSSIPSEPTAFSTSSVIQTPNVPLSTTAVATPTTEVATPTITPGPELTTITNCPLSSTLVGGTQTSCWWKMPAACAAMSTGSKYDWEASWSVEMCTMSLWPLPSNIASCFPNYFDWDDEASTIYSCLETASFTCTYASDCTTATYPVGEEPTTTAEPPTATTTVTLQNAGFELGTAEGWSFDQPLTPFSPQDVSPARARTGSQAFRAVFPNDNGHFTEISQTVNVEPGAFYALTAWVSHDNPAGSWCGFSVYGLPYVDWAQTQLSLRDVPAGEWQQIETDFQAAASYATIYVSFYCNVGGAIHSEGGKNTIYIDDVALVKRNV